MALGTLVAGAYTTTYNAVAVGLTRTGFTMANVTKAELINETDGYGLTTIDWIYRGADAFMSWNAREYKAGSTGPWWPYGGGTIGKIISTAVPIGVLASAIASALVLTSVANTPAASSPATLTASKSLIAPNFDAELLFDSRLREVPVRLQLLPYTSSSDTVNFSLT